MSKAEREVGGGLSFGYASFSYPRIASAITAALSINSFHTHMHMVLMWAAKRVGVAQQGLQYDMFAWVVPKARPTQLPTCVSEWNGDSFFHFSCTISKESLGCWL